MSVIWLHQLKEKTKVDKGRDIKNSLNEKVKYEERVEGEEMAKKKRNKEERIKDERCTVVRFKWNKKQRNVTKLKICS